MKNLIKVVVGGLLAVAAALVCFYIFRQMGSIADDTSPTEVVGDAMLTVREMFLEKPDDIQLFTAALIGETDLCLLRGADGLPHRVENGVSQGVFTLPEPEAQAHADAVFGAYACGGEIYRVDFTADAVLFYTFFMEDGCAGFLYERELGETALYDYIELVENWKIFYRLPPE